MTHSKVVEYKLFPKKIEIVAFLIKIFSFVMLGSKMLAHSRFGNHLKLLDAIQNFSFYFGDFVV